MNIAAFVEQLIDYEGERLKPYVDTVGKVTIGVGRNLTDKGISKEESRLLLANDIREVTGALDRHLPWWRGMDEIRQRVIADMCFNMGIGTLLGFTKTLKAMEEHRYSDAADGMRLSQWASQVGRRAEGLSHMMEKGIVDGRY